MSQEEMMIVVWMIAVFAAVLAFMVAWLAFGQFFGAVKPAPVEQKRIDEWA